MSGIQCKYLIPFRQSSATNMQTGPTPQTSFPLSPSSDEFTSTGMKINKLPSLSSLICLHAYTYQFAFIYLNTINDDNDVIICYQFVFQTQSY